MCFYTRPSTKLKFTEKKQGQTKLRHSWVENENAMFECVLMAWVLCYWNGFDLPLNALHNKYKNLKNKNTSTCKDIHTPSPNIDSLNIQTLTKCDRQIPTHAEERGISEKQAWPLAEEKTRTCPQYWQIFLNNQSETHANDVCTTEVRSESLSGQLCVFNRRVVLVWKKCAHGQILLLNNQSETQTSTYEHQHTSA